jgi:uncharacterized protein YdeI (YjbR/CyaY-like superfamily)
MAQRELEVLAPKDVRAWRRWLEKHHTRPGGVWLVINKKGTPRPGIYYEEAVEQALCFGWIDGRVNQLDERRYRTMFSPRRRGGTWAKSNRERVERLIESGCMTPAGLAKVEEAKKDGSWNAVDLAERLEMPPDLKRGLASSEAARRAFAGWTDSYRKRVYWWITSAKREETRARRLARVLSAAANGDRPFQ